VCSDAVGLCFFLLHLVLTLFRNSHRFIMATIIFRDNMRRPLLISVKVPKTGTLADLKSAIAAMRPGMYVTGDAQPCTAVLAEDILVCRVSMNSITTLDMPDETPLKRIGARDALYVYQTHALPTVSLEAQKQITLESRVNCKFHGTGEFYPGRVTRRRVVPYSSLDDDTKAILQEHGVVDATGAADSAAHDAADDITARLASRVAARRAKQAATRDAHNASNAGSDGSVGPSGATADGGVPEKAAEEGVAEEGSDAEAAPAASSAPTSSADDADADGKDNTNEAVSGDGGGGKQAEAEPVPAAPMDVELFDVTYDDGDFDVNMPRCVMEARTGAARLSISHRCLLRARSYFLMPFEETLFCRPFVLRVLPAATTGRQLYMMAWQHSAPYIRKSGRRVPSMEVHGAASRGRAAPSLSHAATTTPVGPGAAAGSTPASVRDVAPTNLDGASSDETKTASPSATSVSAGTARADAGAGAGVGAGAGAVTPHHSDPGDSDSDSVGSGDSVASRGEMEYNTMLEYGFVLRHVSDYGTYCSRCPWTKCCRGCPVDPNTMKLDVDDGEHIVVDWDPVLIDEAFDRTRSAAQDTHYSVATNKQLQEQPLSLSQCLHVFTKDEKLEAFCSKCSRVGDEVFMRQQVCGASHSAVIGWCGSRLHREGGVVRSTRQ